MNRKKQDFWQGPNGNSVIQGEHLVRAEVEETGNWKKKMKSWNKQLESAVRKQDANNPKWEIL